MVRSNAAAAEVERFLTFFSDNLQKYFVGVKAEIEKLNCEDSTTSGRKIAHLIRALEEVQEFHQLDANMQVRQFLAETRDRLLQMLRIVNVKQDVLIQMQNVSDLSYAWEIISTLVFNFHPTNIYR